MAYKFTRKDIITKDTDKRLEDALHKSAYFADDEDELLDAANDPEVYPSALDKICKGNEYPFINEDRCGYKMMVVVPNPQKSLIPLDFDDEWTRNSIIGDVAISNDSSCASMIIGYAKMSNGEFMMLMNCSYYSAEALCRDWHKASGEPFGWSEEDVL